MISDITSLIDGLLPHLHNIKAYRTECTQIVSTCDNTLNDLDHFLELNQLDCVKLSKLIKQRKLTLVKRRMFKDEIMKIDKLLSVCSDPNSVYRQLRDISHAIQEANDDLNNRHYTPRTDISKSIGCENDTGVKMIKTMTRSGKIKNIPAVPTRLEALFKQIEQ